MRRILQIREAIDRRRISIVGIFVPAVSLVIMLAIAAAFLSEHWNELFKSEIPTASLRNLFIVLAAIVGVPLAIWRSAVAKQQASATERQAETGEKRLSNEVYEKGAEMLGSATPSVRLGGIYSLNGLAKDNSAEYKKQVIELLCAFVRNPPKEEGEQDQASATDTSGKDHSTVPQGLRDDVQTAVSLILQSNIEKPSQLDGTQQRQLDFRGARLEAVEAAECQLESAMLNRTILSRGNLRKAKLSGSRMIGGSMKGANVSGADLSGCSFQSSELSGLHANDADFSGCRINGVNLVGALANEATFSKCSITGSILQRALLQRARLDHCSISNTDLTGASLLRAVLSGTKFGTATRSTPTAEGWKSETLYCLLTQAQLDEALAHPDFPPIIEAGTLDVETGQPLEWRGGCITEDQFPQIYGPQQIVKEGNREKRQGAFFEWKEMRVRLIPAIVERLRGKKESGVYESVCELLEQEKTTGCKRITFRCTGDSDLDSCGITRWDDEGRIWVLFTYREMDQMQDSEDFKLFERNGPESEGAWERWLDGIDWTKRPLVDKWPAPPRALPLPRKPI